jgi:hypothetical protein
MLEPNPDARASRIGPLLERIDAPPSAPPPRRERVPREAWEGPVREILETEGPAHVARERARDDGAPPVIRALVALALTLAMVAVRIATHALVPIALGFLSIVFGRKAMYRAAMAVRAGGDVAVDAMEHARDRLQGSGDDVQVRVVGSEREEERRRVRLEDDPDDDATESERPSERQRRR